MVEAGARAARTRIAAGTDPMTPHQRASHTSRPAASPPARPSHLEALFELHLKARNVTAFEREYRFHPKRRWRLDFAWPVHKLAVEIQGGIFTRGRHTRGAALTREYEKLNAAQLLGWTVLLVTGAQVESGDAADVVAVTLKARETREPSGEPSKLAQLHASPYVSEQPKVASDQTTVASTTRTLIHRTGDTESR